MILFIGHEATLTGAPLLFYYELLNTLVSTKMKE